MLIAVKKNGDAQDFALLNIVVVTEKIKEEGKMVVEFDHYSSTKRNFA